jgi:hypothetical protein
MKQGLSDIVFVLDRSGSMMSIADDTIGGFNSFLAKLKEVQGEATMTLIQFDHEYEVVYSRVPLNNVPELTTATFIPRGQTALLDAIGRAIVEERANIENLDEKDRPEKVIVAILTDGQENNSREITPSKILSYITKLQNEQGWEFIFLGTDLSSIKDAVSYGINACNTMSYQHTGVGVRTGYDKLGSTINSSRSVVMPRKSKKPKN